MHEQPGSFDIAVIGLGCRFPGAASAAEYWRNLCDGVESIAFFSDDQLRAAGVSPALLADPNYVKAAPTLPDIETFDAAFFGYSPKDAALMDPQQRLFLETCYEAFEDAGYDATTYPGRVGVLSAGGGVVSSYLLARLGHADLPGQTASIAHINNDKDFLSTRVSYKLNLTGPSFTVQSACSSSLLAVHYACQNLRFGECDAMLVGGSVVRVPQVEGYLAEKRNLHSLDGHCRPFDAEGQGTIFGSGVGAVLIKPLDKALADRDHVYAVIKGTAANNDGAGKSSYTAPSIGPQADAVTDALARAGAPADSIGYVECHSTGTIVGDPLEIQALTRAFRTQTDRTQFCAVGSVKANIGHPEQAAGIAGLIKASLVLHHRTIPPSINYETPNPEIPFETSPFVVNDKLSPFPAGETPRRAGLNSLGIGGTNVFAVLEEAPPPPARPGPAPSAAQALHVVTLSAKTATALVARVRQLADWLDDNPDAPLGDLCFTTNVGRGRFAFRCATPAVSVDDLKEKLAAWLAKFGGDPSSLKRTALRPVAFLFSGQGSQHAGMTGWLYQTYPQFREVLDQCDALASRHLGHSLLSAIFPQDGTDSLINRTDFTQPALFAVEYALADLVRSWGIAPGAVIGHSLGEFTAACIAGAMTLEDTMRLICERGKLTADLSATGAMAAVMADEKTTRALVDSVAPDLAIAAMNGPISTVVSGMRPDLERLQAELDRREIPHRDLAISNGFHCALVEPALDRFEAAAALCVFSAPDLPLISNVTGALKPEAPDAAYWRDHLRQGVRFADGMTTLSGLDCGICLEIGPHPVLLPMAQACLGAQARDLGWAAVLHRQQPDAIAVSTMLADLFVAGCEIDWAAVHAPFYWGRIALPTYPFERKRYWLDGPMDQRPPAIAAPVIAPVLPPHPLLGPPVQASGEGLSFETAYGVRHTSFLADHRVAGTIVLPTTAELEAATVAGRQFFGCSEIVFEEAMHHKALTFRNGEDHTAQIRLRPIGPDAAGFEFVSTENPDAPDWQVHMTGTLRRATPRHWPAFCAQQVMASCHRTLDPAELYPLLASHGLEYGASFRGVQHLHCGVGECLGRVRLPADARTGTGTYLIHPGFLDACLHVYPVMIDAQRPPRQNGRSSFLPVSVESFACFRQGVEDGWAHAIMRPVLHEDTRVFDIRIYGTDEQPVAEIGGLRVRRLALDSVLPRAAQSTPEVPDPLYAMDWRKTAPLSPTGAAPRTWVIFADAATGTGARLAATLEAGGHHCHLVQRGTSFSSQAPGHWTVDASDPADLRDLLDRIDAVGGPPPGGIAYLWGMDAPDLDGLTLDTLRDASEQMTRSALGLLHALSDTQAGAHRRRLWIVTSGGQALGTGDGTLSPLQAPLWGLGRSAALEHPGIWGGLIDLHPDADASRLAEMLATELTANDGEPQVALAQGQRHVARFVHRPLSTMPAKIPPVRSDATYLVTGGLGMIGLSVARWLLTMGARHLVLTGRNAATASLETLFTPEQIQRANIRLVAADIAQAADVERLMNTIAAEMPPLRGVVHSAGVLADGILAQMDWPRFRKPFEPRVYGGWLLHRATQAMDLDFFILKSSLLSLLGSAGQANYTASSAFLDALAAYRQARGQPATVINWCAWSEGGLATVSGARGEAMWAALGMEFVSPERAMEIFDQVMQHDVGQIAVAVADWPTYARKIGNPPLLAELGSPSPSPSPSRSPSPPLALAATQAPAVAPIGPDTVAAALNQAIADELGFTEAIDPDAPLNEIGLDSLLSVRLSNVLEERFGVSVPVAILIGGPTITQLMETFFKSVVLPSARAAVTPAPMPAFAEAPARWEEQSAPAPRQVPAAPAARADDPRDRLAGMLQGQLMAELGFQDRIDPDQPLSEIGLDSLLSVRLANKLEESLGVMVPVSELIKGPTINDLVEQLARDSRALAAVALPAPATVGRPVVAAPIAPAPAPRTAPMQAPRQTDGAGMPAPVIVPSPAKRWLIAPQPRPDARARLFCFPYAGGGVVSFRNWLEHIDPSIELVAVEPPGRGSRLDEPAVKDMDAFVGQLLPELTAMLDKPAAFFGHCLGGLTMFATLCALRDSGRGSAIHHAFACGIKAPDRLAARGRFEKNLMFDLLGHPEYDMRRLPFEQSEAVVTKMIAKFDTPAAERMLAIPKLRELLLPTIRTEFAMAYNFDYRPVAPFGFPITSFTGNLDPWVKPEDSAAWGAFTSAAFRNHVRDGSHFLMSDDRAYITRTINEDVLGTLG